MSAPTVCAPFDECRDVLIPAGGEDGGAQLRIRTYLIHPADSVERDRRCLFILHHGAGQCALTWAMMAAELRSRGDGGIAVLCYDARRHGASDDGPEGVGLTAEQMTSDLAAVVKAVYGCTPLDLNMDVVLVGHSMGGAVVARAANCAAKSTNRFKHLVGITLVDIVEGTARDALLTLRKHLQSRPTSFASTQAAIEWVVRSGTVHNAESAALSVPSQLVPVEGNAGVRWRTDLLATEPYWNEWFDGLSERFLKCPTAKLLLLANTDRLDKALTIAQIQGKFQMTVMTQCGHMMQEDAPAAVAETLVTFWKRNARHNLPPAIRAKLAQQRQ